MKKYDQTSEGSISLSVYSIENMENGSENMDNSNNSEFSEELGMFVCIFIFIYICVY
jgi:hypothetical protein